MKKTAMVIIDVQNIYFPGGVMELVHPVETAKQIQKVLKCFREKNLPIFHVQHNFETELQVENMDFLQSIHKSVSPIEKEVVIHKTRPSSFFGTNLQEELQKAEVEALVIVGMMSHMCVDTTVRAAQDYGYEVTVLEDGCTTKNLMTKYREIDADTVHDVFMASLEKMFATVTSIDAYILKM